MGIGICSIYENSPTPKKVTTADRMMLPFKVACTVTKCGNEDAHESSRSEAKQRAEDHEGDRRRQDTAPGKPFAVLGEQVLVFTLRQRQRRRGDCDAEADQDDAERRRQKTGTHVHQWCPNGRSALSGT